MFVIFKKELDKDGKKQIDEDKTCIRCSSILLISLLSFISIGMGQFLITKIPDDSYDLIKTILLIIFNIILMPVMLFNIFCFFCSIIIYDACHPYRFHFFVWFLVRKLYCKKPKEKEKYKYQPYQEKKIDKTTAKSDTKFTIVFFTIIFILLLFACYIKWRLKDDYMMDALANIIFILSTFFSLPIFIIFFVSYIYGFFQTKDETTTK